MNDCSDKDLKILCDHTTWFAWDKSAYYPDMVINNSLFNDQLLSLDKE